MQSPFYVNPDSHKGCRGKKTRSTRLLRQQKQKGGNFSLEVAILQDVWYIVYMVERPLTHAVGRGRI